MAMPFPPHLSALRLTMLCGEVCLLLFCGCASKPSPSVAAPVPTNSAAVVHSVVGEIAIVDEEQRFVLIDLGSNLYVPELGAPLRATNRAGETAHLKTSPEQKRPFVAADIVDGKPMVGDEVLR